MASGVLSQEYDTSYIIDPVQCELPTVVLICFFDLSLNFDFKMCI